MHKKKVSPKKIILGLFLFCGAVLLLYFLFPEILGAPICKDRENNVGWDCWYAKEHNFMPPVQDYKYRKKCEEKGGEYHSEMVSQGMVNYNPDKYLGTGPYFFCILPFSDYGTECSGGQDCYGFCEFVGKIPEYCICNGMLLGDRECKCSKKVVGTCSKWGESQSTNSPVKSVEDGNIYYNTNFVLVDY